MRPFPMLFAIILCVSNQACSGSLSPALTNRLVPLEMPSRITSIQHSPQLQRVVAVEAGRKLLSGPLQSGGLMFEPDPIGFVRAAWWAAGVDLYTAKNFNDPEMHGLEILYRSASNRQGLFQRGPRPGDLVFLGRPKTPDNPLPEQVALVESIFEDGTVVALGRFADGPGRVYLNLSAQSKNSKVQGARKKDGVQSQIPLHHLFWAFALPY